MRSSSRYAWYVVWILHALYICSYIDRQLIGILVYPMKRDLLLTDTQIGLIQGLGFALLYSTVGIPIGRLVDRCNRKWIIAWGVLLWSLMTALSAAAQSVATLFLARTGVGVGEAALSPSAYSTIADLFPKEKLGRALSVYGLGGTIGSALAVIVGGLLVTRLDRHAPFVLPILGRIYAWQATYLIVGLPGLVLVGLFLVTVDEPARKGLLRGLDGEPIACFSMHEALTFMRSRWSTYVLLFTGHAFCSLAAYASAAWMPTYFMRTHGWTAAKVAETYGVVSLVFCLIGPYFSGLCADRLYTSGRVDASVRLSALSLFALSLCTLAMPLMESATLTLCFSALYTVLLSLLVGLPLASIQMITPNQLRGQVSAVFLFVVNIVGIGLGATSVGFLTDHVFGVDKAVGLSLAIVPTTALILGGTLLLLCCGRFRRSVALAETW